MLGTARPVDTHSFARNAASMTGLEAKYRESRVHGIHRGKPVMDAILTKSC
ncbi:MAG: hypothetical protein IT523_11025 [Burkholderiales bacterium]|nr:hypothetical protein [Burkholderiales bacterium]